MLRRIWSPAVLAVGMALGVPATAAEGSAPVEQFPAGSDGITASVKSAAAVMAATISEAEAARVQVKHKYRGYGWGGHGHRYSNFSIGFSTGYRPSYYGGYGGGYPRYGYGGYGSGYSRYGYGGYGYGYPSYGYGRGYPSYYRSGFSLSIYSAPRYYAAPARGYSSITYHPSYYPGGWCSLGGLTGGTLTPTPVYATAAQPQAIPAPTLLADQLLPPPRPLTATRTAQLLPPPMPVGQRVPTEAKFRYDGGPTTPVPLPTPEASATPERIDPAREHPISLPTARKSANKYPAYGEKK